MLLQEPTWRSWPRLLATIVRWYGSGSATSVRLWRTPSDVCRRLANRSRLAEIGSSSLTKGASIFKVSPRNRFPSSKYASVRNSEMYCWSKVATRYFHNNIPNSRYIWATAKLLYSSDNCSEVYWGNDRGRFYSSTPDVKQIFDFHIYFRKICLNKSSSPYRANDAIVHKILSSNGRTNRVASDRYTNYWSRKSNCFGRTTVEVSIIFMHFFSLSKRFILEIVAII